MKNYLQNGHIVRVTTPAGGIASGDALIVGSIFGIAAYSSAEGDPVELSTTGVFQLPKASAAVLAVGARACLHGVDFGKYVRRQAPDTVELLHDFRARETRVPSS